MLRRPHRWFEPYLWGFGGGFGIGVVYALVARPSAEVVLADSWSCVPADEWWLHGIVVGVALCAMHLAVVLGWMLVGVLFRSMLLSTVAGLILVSAAAFFVGRAFVGDETTGGRVAWVVMGVFVGGLGVPMIATEVRARLRRRRTAH